MNRASLRRDMLHPLLHNSVCDNFTIGDYDIAVGDAFLIVEDRARIASGIKGDASIKLMRAAFNPNGGPAKDLMSATSFSSNTLGSGLPQTMAPTTVSCRIIGAAMIELYW